MVELTPRQRLILILYYDHTWTDEEIGEAIGVSHQAVNRCRNVALREMRKNLESESQNERMAVASAVLDVAPVHQ